MKAGFCRLAGVDEAGRGPLAGPVVAAAVVFPATWIAEGLPASLREVNDSKQLPEHRRESLFAALTSEAQIACGIASVAASVIDRVNILRATHQAMLDALDQIQPAPDHVLVDGLRVSAIRWPQSPLVKGDSRSYSIAAASILAKVTRDRLMVQADLDYPGYGFARHKGYGTPEHLEALQRLGPCPLHRRSFAPLKPAQGELFG